MAREGHKYHVYTYLIKPPKKRNSQAPRSGVIAVFVILTSPTRGVENKVEQARVGSNSFD